MKKEPKVVIDTNIFVSCLIGKSETLSQIYQAFLEGRFTPILSSEMRLELMEVIKRPKFKKYFVREEIRRFEELLKTDSFLVPFTKDVDICRDAKDNIVLECAISSPTRAECIVTGDKALLALKSFHSIPIVKPSDFLKRLRKK